MSAVRPPINDISAVRAEVQAFAVAMENRLRANDWKPHWRGGGGRGGGHAPMRWHDITRRILGELSELQKLLRSRTLRKRPDFNQRVINEAADVANFAMMAADLYGNLPYPKP